MSSFKWSPIATSSSGSTPTEVWHKFTYTFSDISDPSDMKSFTIGTFVSAARLVTSVVNVTEGFTGGTISDANLTCGIGHASDSNIFASTDIFAASPNTYFTLPGNSIVYDFSASHDITITFQTIDGNLNALTHGSVDVYLLIDTGMHGL